MNNIVQKSVSVAINTFVVVACSLTAIVAVDRIVSVVKK